MMGEFPIFRKVDRRKYGTHFARGSGRVRLAPAPPSAAAGRICPNTAAALARTTLSASPRAVVSAGTATTAAGPIVPRAPAAPRRTILSPSRRAPINADTASPAGGPIHSKARAAFLRVFFEA